MDVAYRIPWPLEFLNSTTWSCKTHHLRELEVLSKHPKVEQIFGKFDLILDITHIYGKIKLDLLKLIPNL